jgi:hypothetical protein
MYLTAGGPLGLALCSVHSCIVCTARGRQTKTPSAVFVTNLEYVLSGTPAYHVQTQACRGKITSQGNYCRLLKIRLIGS